MSPRAAHVGVCWGSTAAWAPCRARRDTAGLQLPCGRVHKETQGSLPQPEWILWEMCCAKGQPHCSQGLKRYQRVRTRLQSEAVLDPAHPCGSSARPEPSRGCPSLLGARWLPWLNFGIKPCALTSHHPVPQGPQQAAEGVLAPGTPQLAFGCLYSRWL